MTALRRWLPTVATLSCYLGGIWLRWMYILHKHDPRDFVYSDMKMYMRLAQNLANPDHIPTALDVTHPPAMSMTLAWFLENYPDLQELVYLQLGVSILVPLSVGLLGLAAFGRKTALWAIAVSSLYFPFIDYGGYFLAEIYMMLLIPLCMALYLWAATAKRLAVRIAFAVAAGGVLFVAFSFKMVAIPGLVGFAIVHLLFYKGPRFRVKAAAFAIMLLTALPGAMQLQKRCTEVTGFFCVGSNKSGADFLMGHYGRVRSIRWKPKKGGSRRFGSPAAVQHGYSWRRTVDFSITDREQNMAAAWGWIRENRFKALVLSTEHVTDAFGVNLPWPSWATDWWAVSQAAQYIFLVFFGLPAIFRFIDIARRRGFIDMMRSMELSVISPYFGLALAVFIATGEARYRLPFDAVGIVVGLQFYLRFKLTPELAEPDAEEAADDDAQLLLFEPAPNG